MTRRQWCASLVAAAAPEKSPILLRSGWQTVNIGDIAHTPGVLGLLEEHLPDRRVILWCNALDRGVREMLARHYPRVRVVSGEMAGERATTSELHLAIQESGFFLHGSGPGVVAQDHMEAWRRATKRPYGIFGTTITASSEAASSAINPKLKDLLSGASFVFTRETKSLDNLQNAGLQGPALAFVPDGAFSLKIRDEARASEFRSAVGLKQDGFLVVVPRLRYTPYHKFRKVDWSAETIRQREEVNSRHAEPDCARFRAVITAWVRQAGLPVVLCPEMTYETEMFGPLLYDPLPDDVKARVVRHDDYWLPDEAASLYARAGLVLSYECHSPIIAVAQGTPALYVHQPEDGIKGQMWADVGLQMCYADAETATADDLVARALDCARRKPFHVALSQQGQRKAKTLQAVGMKRLASVLA